MCIEVATDKRCMSEVERLCDAKVCPCQELAPEREVECLSEVGSAVPKKKTSLFPGRRSSDRESPGSLLPQRGAGMFEGEGAAQAPAPSKKIGLASNVPVLSAFSALPVFHEWRRSLFFGAAVG